MSLEKFGQKFLEKQFGITTLWRIAGQGQTKAEDCKCVYKLFVSFSPILPQLLNANKLRLNK
jgi:hypothetical protein